MAMATRRTKGESYWPIRIMLLTRHCRARPGNPPFFKRLSGRGMDARIKSGHDMRVGVALLPILSTLLHIATNESRDAAHLTYALRAVRTCHHDARPNRPTGFQSPSKNIACQYFDYDKQNILRCDISTMDTKPRRPADCE